MNVVIVESAAKAKTINKYLGSGYKVIASFGHVRDLPAKNGSVEPDKDFEMHWDVDPKSQKIMKEIADAVKKADKLILATDPDREGEAISWHILQILEQKKALKKDTLVERVAFNAVTKQAILDRAERAPPDRRAARCRLFGAPRPRLSRRLHPVAGAVAQAAGRPLGGPRAVRRAAPRLRPRGRDRGLPHRRVLDHRRRDGDRQGRGVPGPPQRHRRHDAEEARHQERATTPTPSRPPSRRATSASSRVDKKGVKRNPYAPFATSTLQMDASRKLGFSAKQTMQVAQRLYEGVDIGGETVGLITYMRTDGVTIVPEAISAIRGAHRARVLATVRRPVHPRIQDQGQERPGGARSHPSDRGVAQAVRRRQVPREGPGAAL